MNSRERAPEWAGAGHHWIEPRLHEGEVHEGLDDAAHKLLKKIAHKWLQKPEETKPIATPQSKAIAQLLNQNSSGDQQIVAHHDDMALRHALDRANEAENSLIVERQRRQLADRKLNDLQKKYDELVKETKRDKDKMETYKGKYAEAAYGWKNERSLLEAALGDVEDQKLKISELKKIIEADDTDRILEELRDALAAQRARAEVARLEAESRKRESERVYRQAISFASNIEDSLAMSVEQFMQGRMAAMNLNPGSSSDQPQQPEQPPPAQAQEQGAEGHQHTNVGTEARAPPHQSQGIPPNLQEIHIPPFPTASSDFSGQASMESSLFRSYNNSADVANTSDTTEKSI